MSAYWRAVDATVCFNVERREAFLAKKSNLPKEGTYTTELSATVPRSHDADPMRCFFRRHSDSNRNSRKHGHGDRVGSEYVETHMGSREDYRNTGNRFMLPRLRGKFR